MVGQVGLTLEEIDEFTCGNENPSKFSSRTHIYTKYSTQAPLGRWLLQYTGCEDEGGNRQYEDSPAKRKRVRAGDFGDFAERFVLVQIDVDPCHKNKGERRGVQIVRPGCAEER